MLLFLRAQKQSRYFAERSGSIVAVYADEEAVINSSDMTAITTMSDC